MRYLIGLLIFIFLVIFIIIRILSGGSGETPKAPQSLASYANTDTTVRWVLDNPTSASETHRDITIEVGQSVATLTITKGYEGEIISTNSFPMNSSSYSAFLKSLEKSGGFTIGDHNKKLADETGYCATGTRYSYDVIDGSGDEIQHLWSASCTKGTFKGLPSTVSQLFKLQIPNYGQLTQDVDLG